MPTKGLQAGQDEELDLIAGFRLHPTPRLDNSEPFGLLAAGLNSAKSAANLYSTPTDQFDFLDGDTPFRLAHRSK